MGHNRRQHHNSPVGSVTSRAIGTTCVSKANTHQPQLLAILPKCITLLSPFKQNVEKKVGPATTCPRSVLSQRKTDRDMRERCVCGHILQQGEHPPAPASRPPPHFLTPSISLKQKEEEEEDRANYYMAPCLFFLKERQAGKGERDVSACGQLLHVALWSILVLLKERQRGLGERRRGVCGQAPFVSLLKERQSGLGETYGVDAQLLHVALYSFFVLLTERQTVLGERRGGGWPNSYMCPPPCVSLLKEKQAGLGKTYGVGGQLLHVAIHSVLSLLKESQTGLGGRERRGWVINSCMCPPLCPF